MAVSANDVQLWIWKTVKVSSQNCVVIMLKYPFISSSLSFLLLLYIFFRLVFWVLIYSSPVLAVAVIAVLRMYGNGKKSRENEKKEENDDIIFYGPCGKPFRRVHSVRRRRALFSQMEDSSKVEEKVAVSLTRFAADQVVDKTTLIEESTVRDVQVDSSVSSVMDPLFVAGKDSKPEFDKGSVVESIEGSSKGSEDDEKVCGEDRNKEAVEWTQEDENSVAEVGISEIERNKRLESLIARRRARKLLSLQVRKTLINIDKTAPLASLVIPTHTNSSGPPNVSGHTGQVSPSPGSAPSILVPMRNPFDLPYDPQEEKPDLTGDGFHQEFISPPNKDMMYCRHESFINVGPFSPEEFNQHRDKAAYREGVGFRHRASQQGGGGFYTPATQFYSESTRTLEAEQIHQPDANLISDSEDDHIKEVIQVHGNGTENNEDKDDKEVETNSVQAESSSSTSTSSSSSAEEGAPFFKIDKEAVLKKLFSPRTTAAQGKEFNDQIGENSSYFPSPSRLGRNSLEEHMYRANRFMRRHAPSYSIASDLQVELSEVSSSVTIDDSFSYRDEDIETYDTDMDLNFSSASANELRSRNLDDISERDILEVGYSRNSNFGDLPSPSIPGDQFLQGHKTHSWASLPLIPELNDSDIDQESVTSFSSDSLEELSSESLSMSAHANQRQSTGNASSRQDELPKQVDYNTVEIKQLETPEPETIVHIEEQSKNLDECHHMEHSTQHNIRSSEERLGLTSEDEEKTMTELDFETSDNYEHEDQLYEGEPSSSAQGSMMSSEYSEERLRATSEHEEKTMTALDFETSDNYEHEDQLYEGESSSAQGNITSSEDLEERLRPTTEHDVRTRTRVVFEIPDHSEHEYQLYEGEPSSSAPTILDSDDSLSVSRTTNVEFQGDPVHRSSSTSPKSVLQQSFSVDLGSTASFDHYADQETQHLVRNNIEVLSPAGSMNSSSTTENLTADPDIDGGIRDTEMAQESPESSERPISGAVNIDSAHENAIYPTEVASGNSQALSIYDALPEQFIPNEETGLSCFTNDNETSIKSFEAVNPIEFGETADSANNSESLIPADEVTGNVAKHGDSNRLSYVDGKESSGICEDPGHEKHDDNSVEGINKSSGSIYSEAKQEEPQNLSTVGAPSSASKEGNDNSVSSEKSEPALLNQLLN